MQTTDTTYCVGRNNTSLVGAGLLLFRPTHYVVSVGLNRLDPKVQSKFSYWYIIPTLREQIRKAGIVTSSKVSLFFATQSSATKTPQLNYVNYMLHRHNLCHL